MALERLELIYFNLTQMKKWIYDFIFGFELLASFNCRSARAQGQQKTRLINKDATTPELSKLGLW